MNISILDPSLDGGSKSNKRYVNEDSEVILTFHQINSGEKSLTHHASKYPMTVELKLLRDEPL